MARGAAQQAPRVPTAKESPQGIAVAPAAAFPVAQGSGPIPTTRTWDAILHAMEAKRELVLLGLFEHARVVSWTGDAIELGFPIESHSVGEMAKEADRVGELRTFLRAHFDSQITLTVRLLDERESKGGGERSVLETIRAKAASEKKDRESEAREHPATKLVLQTFGARIKEIKTDV